MNILFVVHKSEIGGATLSVQKLILNLINDYGCKITLVTPIKGKMYDFCIKNNINVIVSGHDSFIITDGDNKLKKILRLMILPLLWFRHFIKTKKSVMIIEKSINMNEIDIIHTNIIRDDIGGILAKKYNIKHIIHLREFGKGDYNWLSFKKNIIDYSNTYTDKYVAISDCIYDYFIANGVDKSKIVRIYNGIDINTYTYKENKSKSNKLKIVFAGGICHNKGQYQLIKALDYIDDDIIKNLIVDFYGKGKNSYIKQLKKMISGKKYENNINFNDYVENFSQRLLNYNVGVVCSKSEAFGRVTVEYMSCGLITVVSDTGANVEIVDNEKDGFIYKYNDFKNLALKIEKIYKLTSNQRKEISNNAIKKVNRYFTADENTKNIYLLYKELLNGVDA